MTDKESDHQIILFDGVCNFCNYWVNFIINRDKKNKFRFASLQSEKGSLLLDKFNLTNQNLETIILITDGKAYKKSKAVFLILRHLHSWLKFLLILQVLPLFITDFAYCIIAKHRYKIFGKNDKCRVPTAEDKDRFL